MIIVVTSPDSISIGMFVDFLKKTRMPDFKFVNLNALMGSDAMMVVVDETLKRYPSSDVVFKHKTRKRLLPSKLPQRLVDIADCIIGFDLYSQHPEVLKSYRGWTDSVVSEYEEHVRRLNGDGA